MNISIQRLYERANQDIPGTDDWTLKEAIQYIHWRLLNAESFMKEFDFQAVNEEIQAALDMFRPQEKK